MRKKRAAPRPADAVRGTDRCARGGAAWPRARAIARVTRPASGASPARRAFPPTPMKSTVARLLVAGALLLGVLLPMASPLHATVTTFNNHLGRNFSDPHVFAHTDGYYYFVWTLGDRIVLYKSRTLTGLTAYVARSVPLASTTRGAVWAPEIHRIGSSWYIYYTAGANDAARRIYVMENTAADPTTGTWTDRGQVTGSGNGIDATTFVANGQRYFMYAGYDEFYESLYIARMSSPTALATGLTRIANVNQSWENGLLEGPAPLVRGGKVFIAYSTYPCDSDNYRLGLLTANETADLLSPASWTKSGPWLNNNTTGNAFASGHNCFAPSKDGTEWWIVYHSNTSAGQGCGTTRKLRIQKVSFDGSGNPQAMTAVATATDLAYPAGEGQRLVQHQTEDLSMTASSGDTHEVLVEDFASGRGRTFYNSNAVGDYVTYTFNVPVAATYDIWVYADMGPSRGIAQTVVDGTNLGVATDYYSSALLGGERFNIGSRTLSAGNHTIRFSVTGKNASSTSYTLGFDVIYLTKTSP